MGGRGEGVTRRKGAARCRHKYFGIGIIFLGCLAACGKGPEEPAQIKAASDGRGGTLVLSVISDPKTFNPLLSKENSSSEALKYLFEGLTTEDGVTTEILPALAESWSISPDGREYIFRLRSGVLWSDGQPFTSADVVFTYNRLIANPDIPSSMRDIMTLKGKPIFAEAIDDLTVRFKLESPFAPFLRSTGTDILPKHILVASVDKGEFNSTWTLEVDPAQLVGTGPFVMSDYLPSQRIIYKKNQNYWKKDEQGKSLPLLDGIIVMIVPNLEAQILMFEAGETHATGLRGQDWLVLESKTKKGGFSLINAGASFSSQFIFFNLEPDAFTRNKRPAWKQKLFEQIAFRKAMAHAVDRQSIINNVMFGFGIVQKAPISPANTSFHNPNIKPYAYDLTRAAAILDEAGFTDQDGDGLREDGHGNNIKFELLTNSENDIREKIGEIFRSDLKALGIRVIFRPIQFNQLVERLDSTGDWEAILLGLTGGSIDPHSSRNVWWSGAQLHMWHPRQPEPVTEWEAEIDKIFDEAAVELDSEKRKALYFRFQEIVMDKLPLIYTAHASSLFAIRDSVQNTHPTSYGGMFHNIEEVWIKE